MKRILLFFIVVLFSFYSCDLPKNETEPTKTEVTNLENPVKQYLLENLSNPETYKPLATNYDSLSLITSKHKDALLCVHTYEVKNNKNELVVVTAKFYLSFDMKIIEAIIRHNGHAIDALPKDINGDSITRYKIYN